MACQAGRVPLAFTAPLWEHPGEGAWHFVTMPADVSDEVRALAGPRRGFGSVRVRVTVGTTRWETSVFPNRQGAYDLPVKRAVRHAEDLVAGEVVTVSLELVQLG